MADNPATPYGDHPLRKIEVSADRRDSTYSLWAPHPRPSHKSRAPTGRYITAPFMIDLGSTARQTSETGSTRPGKKWQLLLASCTDHKRWKRLPCVPKHASFKMPAHPAQQGRSFKEGSWPLSRLLSGSAWCAAPPGHGYGGCLSGAQLSGPPCHTIACPAFCASSSSPLTLLLLLQDWPYSANGNKVSKRQRGTNFVFPWGKRSQQFFLERAPNFTPFFPHKRGKEGETACTKGYFHTCR